MTEWSIDVNDEARYQQFAQLADRHRSLIGQVDQKIGREKAVIKAYISALDRRLRAHPRRSAYYPRWRKETGQGVR